MLHADSKNKSFPFLNLYPFSGGIFSCFLISRLPDRLHANIEIDIVYNNNFKIKHFHAREDMNFNEFADFGSKKYI